MGAFQGLSFPKQSSNPLPFGLCVLFWEGGTRLPFWGTVALYVYPFGVGQWLSKGVRVPFWSGTPKVLQGVLKIF